MTSEVRYATKEDLEAFYKDDPIHYSARAVVVVKDGEVVGVGGVSRVEKKMVVFTDMREGKVSKKDIVKASRLMLN